MLEINVSAETEQILESLAEQNRQSVADYAGILIERYLKNAAANGNGSEAVETELESAPDEPPQEPRYMRMKGMFSSGKTDTSARAKEILRAEIGRNGFGDFESK